MLLPLSETHDVYNYEDWGKTERTRQRCAAAKRCGMSNATVEDRREQAVGWLVIELASLRAATVTARRGDADGGIEQRSEQADPRCAMTGKWSHVNHFSAVSARLLARLPACLPASSRACSRAGGRACGRVGVSRRATQKKPKWRTRSKRKKREGRISPSYPLVGGIGDAGRWKKTASGGRGSRREEMREKSGREKGAEKGNTGGKGRKEGKSSISGPEGISNTSSTVRGGMIWACAISIFPFLESNTRRTRVLLTLLSLFPGFSLSLSLFLFAARTSSPSCISSSLRSFFSAPTYRL